MLALAETRGFRRFCSRAGLAERPSSMAAFISKNAKNGDKRAGDPVYNMTAQLLGAKLNINAQAGTCAALQTAFGQAQTLLVAIGFDGLGSYAGKNPTYTLSAQQKSQAQALAGVFGSYNEGTLGGGCPTHV